MANQCTVIGNDLTAGDADTIACSGSSVYVIKVLILIVSGHAKTNFKKLSNLLWRNFQIFCGYCQTMKILPLKCFCQVHRVLAEPQYFTYISNHFKSVKT